MEAEFNEIEGKALWHLVFQEIRQEANKYRYTSKDSRKVENKNLNRYRDVTPFDHSRVRLNRGDKDYINASLIQVKEADRAYILTQGPLPSTIGHFWLMVWEQKTKAILMLNRLIEKGAVKCHQYWPNGKTNSDTDELVLTDAMLKVEFVSQTDRQDYMIRECKLTDLESGQSRIVLQFHYTAWPDFGLPESPASFLKYLVAVRKSGGLELNKYGPAIVHCSAGIGRSGTFCLVDTCLFLIEKKGNMEDVNIRQVLLDMRKYRMGLIQTPEQLRFSYLAILEGAKSLVLTDNDVPSINASDNGLVIKAIGCNEDEPQESPAAGGTAIENIANGGDAHVSPALPLPLPPRFKRSHSTTSPEPGESPDKRESVRESRESEAVFSNDEERKSTSISGSASGSTSGSPIKRRPGPDTPLESPTNNNLSPEVELRRRAREARNEKMNEKIKQIKEKQKAVDARSRFKKQALNVSLGFLLVFGTGFLLNFYLNSGSASLRPSGS